jgi:recombination associated protein RdgC
MWFRNLRLFRFSEPFTRSEQEFEQALRQHAFRPCASLEMSASGWVPPLGRGTAGLVHAANACLLLCARREEKLLPASLVDELVSDRVAEIEEQRSRSIGRKERGLMRDHVIHELLPRAFTRSQHTYAYLAPRDGWLVVDAASARRAEQLTELLRIALGTLPVEPIIVRQEPTLTMTRWLLDQACPAELTMEDECELRDPAVEGGSVRCRRQDPWSAEIRGHLEAGKQIVKMALSWRERLAFVLDEELTVRRLRFLDVVQEEARQSEAEDELQRLEADFTLMTMELAEFFPSLLALFGGAEAGSRQPAAAA